MVPVEDRVGGARIGRQRRLRIGGGDVIARFGRQRRAEQRRRMDVRRRRGARSEEHTSQLQSLMRLSYAVFCLKKNRTPASVKFNLAVLTYCVYPFNRPTARHI